MMSDAELVRAAAEVVFGLPGVGYYGPTKAHGMHQDYRLCATKEEANALYFEFWKGETPGTHEWTQDDAASLEMVSWREGWGPISIPNPLVDEFDCAAVLDKMAADRGFVMMDYSHEDGWIVSFRPETNLCDPDAVHKDRRRAIVLAALRACGVEVGGEGGEGGEG